VKFQVELTIHFMRNSMSNKKWHFSWGIIRPFSKKWGLNILATFFSFLNGWMLKYVMIEDADFKRRSIKAKKWVSLNDG
jgi:hypothetical protein